MKPALDARALFNPAFVSAVVARAAVGHERDHHRPLPLTLAFLIPPLVLHAPTRTALPAVHARLAIWADRNPVLRASFAVRAPGFTPLTRRALRFGQRHQIITIGVGGISPGVALDATEALPGDVAECFRAATQLGRWLPRAGSVSTIYALLGVRP
jgi:hypothetical protein